MNTANGTTQAASDWMQIADQEGLLDGVSDKRRGVINQLLGIFPDTQSRILFLRWCQEMGVQADSQLIVQMLMLMSVNTRLVEHRLQAEFGNVRDIVKEIGMVVGHVQKAAADVAETGAQVLQRSIHLKNHVEGSIEKMNGAANTMIERTQKVVENLDSTITTIAKNKVDTAVHEASETTIRDRLATVVTTLEQIIAGTVKISEAMRALAGKLGDIQANQPLVVGGFSINRLVLKYGAILAFAGILVGAAFGHFALPAPHQVTISDQMLTRFQQGEAFQMWYQRQPAAVRADVDRSFAQAATQAAHASSTP